MEPDELDDLLASPHERPNLEVKAPGPLSNKGAFSARAVRAVLGLANLRDGGTLVVGVTERPQGQGLIRQGLTAADLGTWDNDRLATIVNNYADPSVELTVHHVALDGKELVAVRVRPFRETPTICTRDWRHNNDLILRKGALYVRSLRKTETAEISTSEDMRQLLQIAV